MTSAPTLLRRASSKLSENLRYAVDQAKQAYEFSPNSYTNGSLSACIAAQESLQALNGRVEELLDEITKMQQVPIL